MFQVRTYLWPGSAILHKGDQELLAEQQGLCEAPFLKYLKYCCWAVLRAGFWHFSPIILLKKCPWPPAENQRLQVERIPVLCRVCHMGCTNMAVQMCLCTACSPAGHHSCMVLGAQPQKDILRVGLYLLKLGWKESDCWQNSHTQSYSV